MLGRIITGQGLVIARSSSLAQTSHHVFGALLDPSQGRFDFIAFGAAGEKSQRGQALLLGNEITFQMEERDDGHFVLMEARLVSAYHQIKEDPEKVKYLFLLCDVWYHLLRDEKPYPETEKIFQFLNTNKVVHHLVAVHLVHLFQEEISLPNLPEMDNEERKEYLQEIGIQSFRIGQGSWKFLRDAMNQPLEFFVDKLPSPSVMQEIMVLLRAIYTNITGEEMFSF